MTFSDLYNELRGAVDDRLIEISSVISPSSLAEPVAYILTAGGKRVRPILTMLAAEVVGASWREALGHAVAVEVLHNFTLVHDDIMDRARTRRGRPTVHTRWDESTAILAGDVMIGMAQQQLLVNASVDAHASAQAFADGHVGVCEGQALDRDFETLEEVTLDDYIAMITMKTAKLLEVSAELGGICGGASERDIQALKAFARHLGIAFQIQDDLLDIEADEAAFGKTIGGDVVEGKKTCLFVLADMRANDDGDRRRIQEFKERRGLPKERVAEMRDMYRRLGVIDDTRAMVAEQTQRSAAELAHFMDSEARSFLTDFTGMLLNRTT